MQKSYGLLLGKNPFPKGAHQEPYRPMRDHAKMFCCYSCSKIIGKKKPYFFGFRKSDCRGFAEMKLELSDEKFREILASAVQWPYRKILLPLLLLNRRKF